MLKKIVCAFLAALFCLSLTSCSGTPDDDKPFIAVIVKATNSDFWHKVEDGVTAASIEYNIAVTFEGPESEENYAAQNRLIEKAIDDGATAIVLSAISYDASSALVERAAANGIRVVTIDSTVDSEKIDLFIGTDNYAAGEQAGMAAVGAFAQGEEIRIGLVNIYESTENGINREKGLRDYIERVPNAEIVASTNVNSNTTSATAGALSLLYNHPEINVLIGLNEWMTLGIGNAIQNGGLSDTVAGIGFDTNTACIEMLEDGALDTLIAQNPFAIGYLGVKAATDLLSDSFAYGDQKELYTDVTAVTRENLYDSDIQKILFRFE